MVLNSGKCFGFWEVFLDSGKCFWILGSVFGFWEVFLDSGKCFVLMSHRRTRDFMYQFSKIFNYRIIILFYSLEVESFCNGWFVNVHIILNLP